MPRLDIPEGYAVVQLDDHRWYPMRIDRLYDAQYPEGYPLLCLYQDDDDHHLSFLRRHDAVKRCQHSAEVKEVYERLHWEQLLIETNVYPERCAHYVAILTDIVHCHPFITRRSYGVSVHVLGYTCCCGKHHFPSYDITGRCIEDALEDAANTVYASYQACQCLHTESVRELEDVLPRLSMVR